MATLKGPILLEGSIDGMRFYYDSALKKYIAATKGGATRGLILNNPNFVRQRENMNEFKVASIWASQLVKSLASIEHLHYGYYFPKIVGLSRNIIKHDGKHKKGIRSHEASKCPGLLLSLNFNKKHPFDEVLSQQIDISFSEDKTTVTMKLLEFNTFHRINWPEGYGWCRIILVIAQLPDFVWNEELMKYEPVISGAKKLSVTTYSRCFSRSPEPEDLILIAKFAQAALQQPGSTVVVAAGVEFSATHIEPDVTNERGTGTMKIVACFV